VWRRSWRSGSRGVRFSIPIFRDPPKTAIITVRPDLQLHRPRSSDTLGAVDAIRSQSEVIFLQGNSCGLLRRGSTTILGGLLSLHALQESRSQSVTGISEDLRPSTLPLRNRAQETQLYCYEVSLLRPVGTGRVWFVAAWTSPLPGKSACKARFRGAALKVDGIMDAGIG
jgi:hypothetical protein